MTLQLYRITVSDGKWERVKFAKARNAEIAEEIVKSYLWNGWSITAVKNLTEWLSNRGGSA